MKVAITRKVPSTESYAANVLALGDRVVFLDTGEVRKAVGALTCLSILLG